MPASHGPSADVRARTRDRLWRVATLVLLGLGVHLLAPEVAALPNLAEVLRSLAWPALAVAVLMQLLSYAGSGYLLAVLSATSSRHLSLGRAVAISLAAGSLGLVAGGVVGSSAATSRWLRAAGVEQVDAAMAGPLVIEINNLVMIAVAAIGLVHLLIQHALTVAQLVGFALILVMMLAALGAIFFGRRDPERLVGAISHVVRRIASAVHRPLDVTRLDARVRAALGAWDRRLARGWQRPLAGAVANLGFDMLTLLALFTAAGHPGEFGVLLVGYGLPLLLGKVSFLPGGVGIVEATMTALYVGLGIPNAILVVVVLVYRFLSFWLPTLAGFFVAPFLNRLDRAD